MEVCLCHFGTFLCNFWVIVAAPSCWMLFWTVPRLPPFSGTGKAPTRCPYDQRCTWCGLKQWSFGDTLHGSQDSVRHGGVISSPRPYDQQPAVSFLRLLLHKRLGGAGQPFQGPLGMYRPWSSHSSFCSMSTASMSRTMDASQGDMLRHCGVSPPCSGVPRGWYCISCSGDSGGNPYRPAHRIRCFP